MLQLLEELMELQTAYSSKHNTELLTPREQQISELIAIGVSNKEVAGKLSITEKTVKAPYAYIPQTRPLDAPAARGPRPPSKPAGHDQSRIALSPIDRSPPGVANW